MRDPLPRRRLFGEKLMAVAARDAGSTVRWWKNGDHPGDRIGEVLPDPIGGGTYVRQEGAVVRYFRHPQFDGGQVHDGCGRTWHDHGWIDSGGDGLTVCPGDHIWTGADGRVFGVYKPGQRGQS
ncbi:hypothetical protein [Actinoplanes sp. URMC 104]|uniref:hypothetical protein n=1 Tax=Actinoplanes sp. URMC 104 TaxID=3423409 RepID=UPI003F1BB453